MQGKASIYLNHTSVPEKYSFTHDFESQFFFLAMIIKMSPVSDRKNLFSSLSQVLHQDTVRILWSSFVSDNSFVPAFWSPILYQVSEPPKNCSKIANVMLHKLPSRMLTLRGHISKSSVVAVRF